MHTSECVQKHDMYEAAQYLRVRQSYQTAWWYFNCKIAKNKKWKIYDPKGRMISNNLFIKKSNLLSMRGERQYFPLGYLNWFEPYKGA